MRVAERANDDDPTDRVPGVPAAATATAAAARQRPGVMDARLILHRRAATRQRPRGGSLRAGPGQAVTHGHAGAVRRPGAASPPSPLSPVRVGVLGALRSTFRALCLE